MVGGDCTQRVTAPCSALLSTISVCVFLENPHMVVLTMLVLEPATGFLIMVVSPTYPLGERHGSPSVNIFLPLLSLTNFLIPTYYLPTLITLLIIKMYQNRYLVFMTGLEATQSRQSFGYSLRFCQCTQVSLFVNQLILVLMIFIVRVRR